MTTRYGDLGLDVLLVFCTADHDARRKADFVACMRHDHILKTN